MCIFLFQELQKNKKLSVFFFVDLYCIAQAIAPGLRYTATFAIFEVLVVSKWFLFGRSAFLLF